MGLASARETSQELGADSGRKGVGKGTWYSRTRICS